MRKFVLLLALAAPVLAQPKVSPEKEAAMKADLVGQIDAMKKQAQVMVDSVFSFGELGFQEFETSAYLSGILEKEGFKIEHNYAGVPTAWVASWGSGKPVISLGSDIDDIPQASQKPGVGYHDPIVESAPGHGEGHNSGVPLNIIAALAVKKVMEREHLQGTIRLWPGVAEELVGAKAYFVKAGMFKDVDVCLFTHVAAGFGVSSGPAMNQNGLVSVEYMFKGESAHAAAAPWRGKSALDAVELMDVGWNFRREHLRLAQRSHYVITDGGDQPNVVPPSAAVWYYFREADYDHIIDLWQKGDNTAKGATLMTDTSFTSRLLGSAWPGYFSKPIADDMEANIAKVGMPQWSDEDQALAKGLQKELGQRVSGLSTRVPTPRPPQPQREARGGDGGFGGEGGPQPTGGGSDDIGDVSWNVPTVTLRYPSNIPGGPGHNWANGVSMATPIAHKGVIAGAKVQAMTMIDILVHPELVAQAWDYFNNVQTKDMKYKSFIRPGDKPALWLNKTTMEKYRPEMKKFYYDPVKYDTYLEQLGIKYPTVR
ncbi:MAG TPA: peptidase dimerization domain-containing protein [Bryobacteraceae bacterium]|jgi:aminobenzoyl-glutamate utilization protein B|nr:peptidase dimerization domain-containing protein [Bryobacteraceae bacterium]